MTTSSTLHSAACNFLSYVSTGVDPRTGQYTCGLSLPELNGNGLAGPLVPLRFAFSPLNTLDSGYGLGWTLALTQYHTGTGMLSLASGESFKVTSTSGDGKQLLMEELKLDSVRLYRLDDDHFRVVYKSGLIEELSTEGDDPLALPEFMYSPQGHRVSLAYSVYNDGRMLRSISDDSGRVLLEITRHSTSVRLVQHPRSDHEALFSLILQGSEHRVGRIELPTGNLAGWRFQYQTWQGLQCISRVEGPMGGHEQLYYDDGEHLFPDGERRLPRVFRHLHDPGPGQPVIETRYDYSAENFLGYNAPGLSWEDDGRDNLYQVTANYTYWTREQLWDSVNNRAVRSVRREFNRFHLLVEETTTQGDCVKRVKNDYHILDGEKFRDQPPQCQLPSKATTTWYRISESGRMREDVVSTRFDDHGNLIQRIDADGITEHNEYYPAAGADGCPADPHGFVRNLRSRLVTPASADFSDAPSVRSDYRYVSQPAIAGGSHEWLAQELEVLTQVEGNLELQRTRKLYINQPDDAFLHGRLAKTEVFIDGKGTFTDYFHSRTRGRHAGEDVWRSVEMHSTSFDLTSKTITRERSLYDGQPLLALDDDAVEIAYRYDRLGRVVEETVAPDTPWSAVRSYDYVLVAQTGGRASQTLTDVQQVKTRSTLDGLQRVVLEERQDVDSDPLNKPFRTLASQQYNAFGQLQASHAVDWLGDTDLALSSTYTYDDWGEQASVRGPDGVVEHRFIDPINRRLRTWTEDSDGEVHGIVEVVTNRFDKPLSEERFNRQGQRVSGRYQRYDGLGRGRQDTDELYNNTFYFFDAWSRVAQVVLPDESRVEREYASHSSAELPVRLRVTVDGEAPVLLGEQQFDGLERLTRVDVGPRSERYLYQGGHAQPSERHTAAGRSLHYRYTPQLTRQPTAIDALDEQAGYDYDRFTAQLRAAWNSRGRREFDYDGANNLSAERWIADGRTFESRYSHSRDGRPLLHTDVNGLEQRCDYDDFGRLERMTQGNLEVHYAYDALSRPWLTTCRDLQADSELSTRLAFDEHGREIERTLTLDGLPVQTISQAWRLDDRLESRHQRRGEETQLHETFAYDPRGRLVEHLCSGSETPLDRYGNRIAAQHFEFDALDNLVKVDTLFADGSRDECVRRFAVDDPCRLVQVSHSHADYPASLELEYDADGHLLADELGQGLDYDSQGRLQRVRAADGAVLVEYQYDAHDQLCGETRADQAPTLRFYRGERLGCTVQDATRISYLHDGDRPLGQQQPDQAENTLLLLTGANRSVLGESQDHALRETTYSAYGERGNEAMQSQLGFNGELRDSQTGWYLLGNGYRAYNPWLMCFHSPDSLSPFGAGGLNPYMYCAGDPVNFRDPSGHISLPMWLGITGALLGIVGTVASAGAAGPAFAALSAGTLTGKQALALVSFTSGVASVGMEVTAEVGTSDQHAKGALRLGATIAGVISLVTGFGALAANKGKWRPEKATKKNISNNADGAAFKDQNFTFRRTVNFDESAQTTVYYRRIENRFQRPITEPETSPRASVSSASVTEDLLPRRAPAVDPQPSRVSFSGSVASDTPSTPVSQSPRQSITEPVAAEVESVRTPKTWPTVKTDYPFLTNSVFRYAY